MLFALNRRGNPLEAKIDNSFVACDVVCVLVLAGKMHRALPAITRFRRWGGMRVRLRPAVPMYRRPSASKRPQARYKAINTDFI